MAPRGTQFEGAVRAEHAAGLSDPHVITSHPCGPLRASRYETLTVRRALGNAPPPGPADQDR